MIAALHRLAWRITTGYRRIGRSRGIWRDPVFDGIPLHTLAWWRLTGIARRNFWAFVSLVDPRCPSCHDRLVNGIRLNRSGTRCNQCEEALWDLKGDWGWGE